MNISVVYDNRLYLTEIVQDVTWSGDVKQAYRTLDITVMNSVNGRDTEITYELGKEIRFYSDGAELFRGVIFTTNVDQTGMTSITAYDENVYLTKSIDTRRFVSMTAAQITKTLCNDFGIAVGNVVDTGYVIPKLILRNMSLWDMITTAITETKRQTGRQYYVYAAAGALNLVERKARTAARIIESATNLQTANYRQSIEDLRNQVRVIGGDPDKNPISVTVKDDASIDRYGRMQHLENADHDAKEAQIKQLAAQRLRDLNVIDDEATVTALGYDDTISGAAVYAYDKMTGITGAYYVTSDIHTYSNGLHTMALTLSATDDLPTLEYIPPAETEAKSK